jgi:hypothetical protein
MEDIVAQNERNTIGSDKVSTEYECVCEPARMFLGGVGEAQTEIGFVTEQALEEVLILWGGDEHNVADSRKHQNRQWMVNHWLVEVRQQLLRDNGRHRVNACQIRRQE